ncbi:hypothetical protein BLNAU_25048 [Blattamonas nauphoetae]|uniref:Uncharacterized protein n=1 Tax=Blattamonas nauphoetae TaxID=2049346 RepID=A0ABQ9WKQ5_9EUKA|nr:hypothetical protein BLNAU_25048 [Blattamonas nauphoetae]
MGTTVSQRLGQLENDPKVLDNDAHILLIRKLQIIADSCVGVLHRKDFINFDQDLNTADLSDLSQFLYLAFRTLPKTANEIDDLQPYLFRSATLSIFCHIIVNAMTYIKRGALNDDPKNPFLHIITGTPGMGKTASRYPFITLLMSFGVNGSTIAAGSTLRQIATPTDVKPNPFDEFCSLPKQLDDVDDNIRIEAGSIIKAGSSLSHKSCLAYGYSIQNKLADTDWHVIDEHTVRQSLCPLHFPDGSRWNTTNPDSKNKQYFIAEYVVPKCSLQEEAAFLNTMGSIPTTFDTTTDEHENALRMFSFVPRMVFEPVLADKANKRLPVTTQDKTIQACRQEFFGPLVSHRLVHFSCPQFDCHNWYVQFATDTARRFLLDMFNLQATETYNQFLTTLSSNCEFNHKMGAIFHNFVLDAIDGGLTISSPFQLIEKESGLRDLQTPRDHRRIKHPSPKLNERPSRISARYLSHPQRQTHQDNRKIPKDGATVVTYSTRTRRARASCNSPSSDSISDPFSSSDSSHDSGPATKTEFKCFTYSLNPLGANNSGFDSILLFFKVHNEESNLVVDNPNFVIDALSVIFIQSTLASKHKISASGSNLMFMWIALFSSIYKIHLRDIFPSLFFVKNPYVETFYLEGDNNTEFFMDKRNIWVVDGSARTVEVKYTDRLLLDTIISVLPNTNPNYVRCCFCGLVLEEDFPTSANASNLVGQSNRQKNSSLHRGRPIRLEWEQSGYLTVTTHKKIGNGCLEPECIQILCFTWGEKVNWTKHLAAGQSNTSVSLHNRIDAIDIVLIAPTEKGNLFTLLHPPPRAIERSKCYFRMAIPERTGPHTMLDSFALSSPKSEPSEYEHFPAVGFLTPHDLTLLVRYLEQQEAMPAAEMMDLEDIQSRITETQKYLDENSSSFIGSLDGTPTFDDSELRKLSIFQNISDRLNVSQMCGRTFSLR